VLVVGLLRAAQALRRQRHVKVQQLLLPLLPALVPLVLLRPLPIKILDADEGQQIRNQGRLDLVVDGAVTGEGRRQVHLQQPGVQLLIYEDVEPQQLKAVPLMRHIHLKSIIQHHLSRYYGLDDDVFDLGEEGVVVDVVLLEQLPQPGDSPLGPEILQIVVILHKGALVELIDRVVSQVHELVLLGLQVVRVLTRRKPRQPLLVHIDLQRVDGGECHVDPEVELEAVDEEGVVDVVAGHQALLHLNLAEVVCDEDAFALG